MSIALSYSMKAIPLLSQESKQSQNQGPVSSDMLFALVLVVPVLNFQCSSLLNLNRNIDSLLAQQLPGSVIPLL